MKISHEEMRKKIDNIFNEDMVDTQVMTLDYIKQQEKKDELLELYKEINNKRKELITLARHNTWSWELDIEIKDIQDKIEILEKELEGMK